MYKHAIVTTEESLKIIKDFTVNSIINLNNGKNIISYLPYKDNLNNIKANISVSISACITANARVFMHQFKNDNVYYSDTDSIDTSVLINPKYIGIELGQLKLEHKFKEVVYLAPKVYGGKTLNSEIVRIKGLKNPVAYKELLGLLYKNSFLEVKQDKWLRDISNANISIKEEIYTLMVTDNKRKLIYDENNKFIDTQPLKIDNDNIIN